VNKKVIALAAASLALLAGCDDSPDYNEEQAYVDEEASQATRAQIAEDEKDLQATVKELQSKDPSVKDAYYGVGANGEKQLHIVREEANGQSSDSVWPMVAGAGAAALGGYALAKMMNNSGGYSNYQQQHQPLQTSQCNEQDRRKCRNSGSAAYTSMLMNNNRGAVRANPSYRTNMNNRVSQWRASPSSAPATYKAAAASRATGIMSSSSSARASSHSSGS
jgi:hypothetical protein